MSRGGVQPMTRCAPVAASCERRDIRLRNLLHLCRGIAIVLLMLANPPSALACACCTNQGQRNVATVALDSAKQHEIESLRFGAKASLYTGEGDVEGVGGIATPSGSYHMAAKWQDDRLVLSFSDALGHT